MDRKMPARLPTTRKIILKWVKITGTVTKKTPQPQRLMRVPKNVNREKESGINQLLTRPHLLALRLGRATIRKMVKTDFKFRPTPSGIKSPLLSDHLVFRFGDEPFRI